MRVQGPAGWVQVQPLPAMAVAVRPARQGIGDRHKPAGRTGATVADYDAVRRRLPLGEVRRVGLEDGQVGYGSDGHREGPGDRILPAVGRAAVVLDRDGDDGAADTGRPPA